MSNQVAANRDYQVSVADFAAWEAEHGPLPNGVSVLLRTGFGKSWPNRKAYLDTASIDYGQSAGFESHRILMASNIPAFENIANMDELPAIGFQVIALPLKITGGSGGPLRIVAIVP